VEACRLGPYRLDEVVARSDAATVYRATDTEHGDRTVWDLAVRAHTG
jgi:hypothetical protein